VFCPIYKLKEPDVTVGPKKISIHFRFPIMQTRLARASLWNNFPVELWLLVLARVCDRMFLCTFIAFSGLSRAHREMAQDNSFISLFVRRWTRRFAHNWTPTPALHAWHVQFRGFVSAWAEVRGFTPAYLTDEMPELRQCITTFMMLTDRMMRFLPLHRVAVHMTDALELLRQLPLEAQFDAFGFASFVCNRDLFNMILDATTTRDQLSNMFRSVRAKNNYF
jgi:hypothetical protein